MVSQEKNTNRVSLCVRLSPSRRAAIDKLAELEEKSITRVVEDAVDAYIKPKLNKYRRF